MKQHDTERLFYELFPYKIVIKRLNRSRYGRRYPDGIKKAMLDNVKGWLKNKFGEQSKDQREYRTRTEGTTSVFLRTRSAYDEFCAKFADIILETWSPTSDEHELTLTTERHRVVRPTLFHEEFRYAIRFRWLSTQARQHVASWVGECVPVIDDYQGRQFHFTNGWPASLYLHDNNQVMMVQLALGEHIRRVDHIVLTSEIGTENESPAC